MGYEAEKVLKFKDPGHRKNPVLFLFGERGARLCKASKKSMPDTLDCFE